MSEESKYECQHRGGHLAFPSEAARQTVECPHCKKETLLFLPPAASDLALLKAAGKVAPLPIAASRTVKLGGTVAPVGFPDIGLQGFAPKLAKGENRVACGQPVTSPSRRHNSSSLCGAGHVCRRANRLRSRRARRWLRGCC